MESMIEMLTQQLMGESSRISRRVGADEEGTKKAIPDVMAILTGALARNSERPDGARSLLSALDKDHDGSMHPETLMKLYEEGYLESPVWLTCPAHKVRPGEEATYARFAGPPVVLGDPAFPPNYMLLWEGPPEFAHPDGLVRVLLLDGTVEKIPQDDWAGFVRQQGVIRGEVIRKLQEREQEKLRSGGGGAPS